MLWQSRSSHRQMPWVDGIQVHEVAAGVFYTLTSKAPCSVGLGDDLIDSPFVCCLGTAPQLAAAGIMSCKREMRSVKTREVGRIACIVLVMSGQAVALKAAEGGSESPDFRRIAERLAPSVVHIAGYMGEERDVPFGEATGFFVEESGLIVSVLDAFSDRSERRLCERYRLGLSDGRQLEARLFSADPVLNLALLRMEGAGSFPAVPIERRVPVQPGEAVVAIAGEEGDKAVSYSTGYIKARHKKSVYGAGFGDMLINTQLRLPKHAYGGPLFNAESKLLGLNTENVHAPNDAVVNEDEAHALPVGMVQIFLKVSKAYPTSAQNWLGLSLRPLLPEERDGVYKTLGQRAGLYIDFVWDQGPAGQTDIRPGDVLFKMEGTAIKDTHQLNKLLLQASPGHTAKLAILRERRGFMRGVAIEKRPAWAGFLR